MVSKDMKLMTINGGVRMGDGSGIMDSRAEIPGDGYLPGEDERGGRGGVGAAADRDVGDVLVEDAGGGHDLSLIHI